MQTDAAYYQAAHHHQEQSPYALAKYRITRSWLEPYAKPNAAALNIGCGAGFFNNTLVEMGFRTTACEPDPGTFELAQATNSNAEVALEQCGIDELIGRGYHADVFVLHDVLEHIEDDAATAAKLGLLLKPGGRGIISVPALQVLYGPHDVRLGHYRRYTKRSLRSVLDPHFHIARLRYFGFFSIPIAFLYARVLRAEYPIGATRNSAAMRLFRSLCNLEAVVRLPIGTSLLAEVVAPA